MIGNFFCSGDNEMGDNGVGDTRIVLNLMEEIEEIFEGFLRKPKFKEIEHIPTELYSDEAPMLLVEDCLMVPFSTFERLYTLCIRILTNEDGYHSAMAADLVLLFNGENEKAWNYKRQHFSSLDPARELFINAAVCLKFKKSTILYEYRLQLVKTRGDNPLVILDQQHTLICKILDRFPRNYYCWTYRLKLFQHLVSQNQPQIAELVEMERTLVKKYCDRNIHEYSGFWYLFNLLNTRGQPNWRQEETQWVTGLIDVYSHLYTEEEPGGHLFSLRKYQEWLSRHP